jgi:hypothetical protein
MEITRYLFVVVYYNVEDRVVYVCVYAIDVPVSALDGNP